jgi:PhnB protein
MAAPGGRIGHAEVRIGDSSVMLGDAHGDNKPLQAVLYVYVDDVDATYHRPGGGCNVSAGARQSILW